MKHLSIISLSVFLAAGSAAFPILNAAVLESEGEQEITALCESILLPTRQKMQLHSRTCLAVGTLS